MPGIYDNEKGVYLEAPGLEKGHWFKDAEGNLFIVPDESYGLAEIEGPDGVILDALNAAYQGIKQLTEINPESIAEDLELDFIPDYLKRFDPEVGHYSA